MADFQLHADALLEPKSCMSEDPEVALEDEDRDQEEEEEDQEEEEDMEEGGIRREIRLMKQAGIRDKLELLGKDAEGTTKAIRNVANVHFNAPIQFTVMEKSTAAFNFPDAIAYSKDGLLALNSGALIKVLNADRLFRNSQGFSRKDPFTISTILVSENPHVVLNNSGCKDLRNSLLNNAVFMLEPFLIFAIRTHLDQGDVQTNEFFLPETGGIQALNLLPRQFSCAKWSDPNMTVLNQ